MTLLFVYVASRNIFKARRGNECCFAHKCDMFSTRTMRLLVRSSSLWEAYTKTCLKWEKKFTTTCWCHLMIPCQVSWILDNFWMYRNLETKFSMFAAEPWCQGNWNSFPFLACYLKMHPRTHMFLTHFGALEHVHVVEMWIMQIKCLENTVNI